MSLGLAWKLGSEQARGARGGPASAAAPPDTQQRSAHPLRPALVMGWWEGGAPKPPACFIT